MGSSEMLKQKSGVAQREGRQRVSRLGRIGSNVGITNGADAKFPQKV